MAQDRLATVPPPPHGVLSRCGDGSHADQHGPKNPGGQKGRSSQHQPGFCGLRVVLVLAAWDSYRIPGALRRILPTRHAAYRSENVVLREMVEACVPPQGAKRGMVGGDAADGSKANIRLGQDRDKAESARCGGLVCAMARTWKTGEDTSITHLVPHLPHTSYPCTRVPRAQGRKGRRTLWTSSALSDFIWCI